MSFSEAPKPPEPQSSSGISMSMQITQRSKKVRFTVSASAQDRYFGMKLAGKAAKIMIGGGDDEGLAQIRLDDKAANTFSASARDSAFISVGHWIAWPNDARPAASCEVIDQKEGLITLRLPSWAHPSGAGGKLDQSRPRATITKG